MLKVLTLLLSNLCTLIPKKKEHAYHQLTIIVLEHYIGPHVVYSRRTCYTVEPPNKGHFGNGHFVLFSEAVPISEACHCLTI